MLSLGRNKTQKPPASAPGVLGQRAKRKASVAKRGKLQTTTKPTKNGSTIAAPVPEKLVIDREWFEDRMRAKGFHKMAPVARELGIDKSMMLRSLKGERVFTVKDIVGLARVLGTTTSEVCRRIGYPVEKGGVPFVGTVRDDGKVGLVTAKPDDLFYTEEPPPGASAIKAVMQTSSMHAWNGAVFVFAPAGNPLAAFGQLCVVEAEGHLTPYLGTIVKGKDRNRVALELFGGREQIELEDVHRVSPVLRIQFP